MKEPTIMNWYSIRVVKISEVGEGFRQWLDGQTTPFVYEDENPTDWAYYDDYLRWANGLPICEKCGKEVPQDEICQFVDGNNIAITWNSKYLCKECYEERYGK